MYWNLSILALEGHRIQVEKLKVLLIDALCIGTVLAQITLVL
jgi:hypothetical protein